MTEVQEIAEDVIQNFIDAITHAKPGFASEDEVISFIGRQRLSLDKSEIHNMFHEADADKDGYVSAQDLGKTLNRLKQRVYRGQWALLLKAFVGPRAHIHVPRTLVPQSPAVLAGYELAPKDETGAPNLAASRRSYSVANQPPVITAAQATGASRGLVNLPQARYSSTLTNPAKAPTAVSPILEQPGTMPLSSFAKPVQPVPPSLAALLSPGRGADGATELLVNGPCPCFPPSPRSRAMPPGPLASTVAAGDRPLVTFEAQRRFDAVAGKTPRAALGGAVLSGVAEGAATERTARPTAMSLIPTGPAVDPLNRPVPPSPGKAPFRLSFHTATTHELRLQAAQMADHTSIIPPKTFRDEYCPAVDHKPDFLVAFQRKPTFDAILAERTSPQRTARGTRGASLSPPRTRDAPQAEAPDAGAAPAPTARHPRSGPMPRLRASLAGQPSAAQQPPQPQQSGSQWVAHFRRARLDEQLGTKQPYPALPIEPLPPSATEVGRLQRKLERLAGVEPARPFLVAFRSTRPTDLDNMGLQVSKRFALLE
ncbi:hypothetical protein PAPYR_2971 [Paratrimastix pyriformis]|uniref:EF-hand domain-containing protein n=1 Tax=Paratrimastix pyriformis TaxID=342808 RepID=A0ABQ8UNH8_9EUKA|nr:hypothetical protein PAPYR_2971 [Paratrimastix pyriformis]